MNIAIIGTGNVGSALAKGWAKAGHTIYLGVRDVNNFKGKELLSFNTNIKALPTAEAVNLADVVLIAAVPTAVIDIAKSLGDVSEKTIIDAMNSVRAKPDGYDNTTAALMAITDCKSIVKCFNTTGAENMFNPLFGSKGIDAFMSGDSAEAKQVASTLTKDLGFENCYDFGGSDKFNLQEQLALCWINLAMMQGMGRNIALTVVKR